MWMPLGAKPIRSPDPPIGALIGFEHRVLRLEVAIPLPMDEWDVADQEAFSTAGSPETWSLAPLEVLATDAIAGTSIVAVVRPWAAPRTGWTWPVVGEHFAVCGSCGDPLPCRHEIEAAAASARDEARSLLAKLGENDCWACGNPIAPRQRAVTFAGWNFLVDRPGPVRFHLRKHCIDLAIAYEQRWVAADTSRIARLACEGVAIVHGDGTLECSKADACAGPGARHATASVCFLAGCSDCVPQEHPGIARAMRPDTAALGRYS